MTRLTVFLIYWLSLVLSMSQQHIWLWLILLPTFTLLYTWAEAADDVTT